jgi:hypothetical protein
MCGLWNFAIKGNSGKIYEGVSKSFRTGRLERELQMVQLSATRCSYIAILSISLASFDAITFWIASQRVFVVVSVYFVMTQSGNVWIHPHMDVSEFHHSTCTLLRTRYFAHKHLSSWFEFIWCLRRKKLNPLSLNSWQIITCKASCRFVTGTSIIRYEAVAFRWWLILHF